MVITNKQPVARQTNTSHELPGGNPEAGAAAVPGVNLAAGTIFTGGGILKGDKEVGTQFAPKFISAALPPQIETLKTDSRGTAPPTRMRQRSTRRRPTTPGFRSATRSGSRESSRSAPTGWWDSPSSAVPRSGGAGTAQLTLPEAQFITGNVGRFNQISVGLNPDVIFLMS